MSTLYLEQERLDPYIADVRLTTNQSLIEIDGILAVTAGSQRQYARIDATGSTITSQREFVCGVKVKVQARMVDARCCQR